MSEKLSLHSFLPTDEYVRPLGRTIMLEDCRILSLSASGVEFKYVGTDLTVTFYGDSTTVPQKDSTTETQKDSTTETQKDSTTETQKDSTKSSKDEPEPWRDQARVAVLVDGILQLDTVIKKPKETFLVTGAELGLTEGEHTVRILKLSEPRMSTVGLGEIAILSEGMPSPTAAKEKLIEFIGDSITCGYGVDAPSEWCQFSTGTENVMKGYSYLTAQALDADCQMISYSGHGLISGYTPDPKVPKLEELIPPYYEILSYSYNTFREMKMQDITWDFENNRRPDLIVINLGTNDDSFVQGDCDKEAAYEDSYVKFLMQVHRCNPTSKIACVFGLMGDALFEAQVRAAARFKCDTGYEEVYNIHLNPQNGEANGFGACWHPSEKSHRIAVMELAESLNKIL